MRLVQLYPNSAGLDGRQSQGGTMSQPARRQLNLIVAVLPQSASLGAHLGSQLAIDVHLNADHRPLPV
jgi:hypothetical protein